MAITLSDYKQTRYPSLYKSQKRDPTKGYKYLMWSKIDGKLHKKILGYSEKDKLTDKKAKDKLEELKKDIESGYKISGNVTLDIAYNQFLETLPNTQWTKNQEGVYRLFIKEPLGKKKLIDIKSTHIKTVIAKMDKEDYSKNYQKKILAVLKPFFKTLVRDKVIKEDPTLYITVKLESTKKIVTNATELYNKIYRGVESYYKDNPFYLALFLFILYGRRKSEVLDLKWENIDLKNGYYWIEKTKNRDVQQYPLPPQIKEQLEQIKDDRKGFVFKSPVTGKRIVEIKRQVNQLKKYLGLPTFHLHYVRNVLVSMLAENNTEAIVLSGILGHKDVNTINKYLSINHFKSGQIGAKKIDEVIDTEIIS